MARTSQKMKSFKAVLTVFLSLEITLTLLIISIFTDTLRPIMRLFPLFGLIIFGLGVTLIIVTRKNQVKKPLNRWLTLTGASGISVFLGALLHNLFYAMEVLTKTQPLISRFFGLTHALFFLISVPISPLGFIIGSVGSIYWLKKQKNAGGKN